MRGNMLRRGGRTGSSRRVGSMLGALAAALAAGGLAHAQPLAAENAPVVRYDDHVLARVTIERARDVMVLEGIGADMWSHSVRGGIALYALSPAQLELAREAGLAIEIVDQNIQASLDADNARQRAGLRAKPDPAGVGALDNQTFYTDFRTAAELQARVDALKASRPDLVSTFQIGTSIQGRPIMAASVKRPAGGKCRPLMMINGTQHAREWISPMCVVYYMEELVTKADTDPVIKARLDAVDFVLVPVANPDGYDYTWTTDRFWRKNRRANSNGTFGVDLNRNWGFQWGVTLPGGSGGNNNPNSQTYWGTAPFSEPETQALRDLVLSLPNYRAGMDIHSFGNLIMWSWGYTNQPAPDAPLLSAGGVAQANAAKAVNNLTYTAGQLYSALYPVSGSHTDWMYAVASGLSYIYELRGGAFNPPPSDILPGATETFAAILTHAQTLQAEFPFQADWNNDCSYTIFDYIAFSNDFAAGNLACDLDGNGVLNVFDYILFGNLFAAKK